MARDTSAYQVDGRRVPSVTEVLSLAGVSSFGGGCGIDPDVLAKAAHRGHRVHEWTEWLDDSSRRDDAEPSPLGIEGYCDAYHAFKDESGFKPQHVEYVVVNDSRRYAGTIDRIGSIELLKDERPIVLDLKTSAMLAPEVRLQLSGYRMAFAAEQGTDPKDYQRASLQLTKDGKYKLKFFEDAADDFDWIACIRVAHFRLRHGMAKLED